MLTDQYSSLIKKENQSQLFFLHKSETDVYRGEQITIKKDEKENIINRYIKEIN